MGDERGQGGVIGRGRWSGGGILLLLVLVALVVRARTFGNPVIGFDEQYYLLVGEHMLRGALPYVDLFDRKPIGLFLLYASAGWIGSIVGDDGFLAYKLVATGFVVASAFGIQRVARRFAGAGAGAGVVAAILYIL